MHREEAEMELGERASKQNSEREARRRRIENKESNNYIRSMTKKCPACNSPIMKITG